MKAVITGPRFGLTEDLKLPFMHIELELEELPKVGEVIILNNGTSYYVKNIMWWVDGPRNEAYWSRDQDYNVQGTYQIVHIDVEPDNRRSAYGYPVGLEDGKKQGRAELANELGGFLDLLKSAPGEHDVLSLISAWVAREEQS